jgi:cell division protein FtsI/penicillin-binding protein 2
MDEPIKSSKLDGDTLSFWDRHRLSLLLIIAVLIAIVMTSISVTIYNSSGAAQLDLSRPGYRSVSDKVDQTDEIDTYSSTGAVNKTTIEEFMKLYDAQAAKAKAVDAFNGDPLNPEVLEFGILADQ